jgi:nucleoside-diphosphate-sugar epimerase
MTKIYATGMSGTIGKHLPLDTLSLKLDLSGEEFAFSQILFEPDSNLLHLGGVVGPSEVSKDVRYAKSVNVYGTGHLALEFLKKSDGIFYYISTSHVYAPSVDLITESHPLSPTNVYAEQKLEAEELLKSIFQAIPTRLCIIRIFSVLDWDCKPFTLGGAVKKLSDKQSDFVLANASDTRDFLTPKTIANVLYAIASRGGMWGVVNLCSSIATSVGDAATRMLSESGFEVDNERFSWERSSNPIMIGDNSLLLSMEPDLKLHWEPSRANHHS